MTIDSLTVALIGLIGAVVGGLVNGFYQHVRDWFKRPQLQIDYEGIKGANCVDVAYNVGDKIVSEIYIRALVQNKGHQIARGCRVFLTALREVHPSGTTPTALNDSLVLAWAGYDFLPRDVPRGVKFYVDVMRVSKDRRGWLFSVEKLFAGNAGLKDYSGTYRFSLMVSGDNADPATCEIDVTYAGDWHNLRAVAHR